MKRRASRHHEKAQHYFRDVQFAGNAVGIFGCDMHHAEVEKKLGMSVTVPVDQTVNQTVSPLQPDPLIMQSETLWSKR